MFLNAKTVVPFARAFAYLLRRLLRDVDHGLDGDGMPPAAPPEHLPERPGPDASMRTSDASRSWCGERKPLAAPEGPPPPPSAGIGTAAAAATIPGAGAWDARSTR